MFHEPPHVQVLLFLTERFRVQQLPTKWGVHTGLVAIHTKGTPSNRRHARVPQ